MHTMVRLMADVYELYSAITYLQKMCIDSGWSYNFMSNCYV